MKTLLGTCACIVLLAGPFSSGAGDKKETFDPARMVGKWSYVSGEKAGEAVPKDRLEKQTISIDKKEFTLAGEDAVFVMSYEIDAKKSPAVIRFTMTKSPFGAGAKAAGIIEFKGDELRLCYAEGDDAPAKFETKGSKAHMFVIKKAK